jgi:UPF0755 protein
MRRLALLLLLLLSASVALAYRELRRPVLTTASEPRVLDVPAGANAATIGEQLTGLGLVRHPILFRALVRLRNAGGKLKAGHYTLRGPITLVDILDELERGSVSRFDITFPEGKNIEEMARIAAAAGVDEAAFLAMARAGTAIHDLDPEATDLEGYLFPDTYDVPPRNGRAAELVGQMLRRFRNVLSRLPLDEGEMSVRELVTMASLVELETARADERPRIAAVFLNRLDRGMLLQTDPTVIYALRLAGTYDGNIRKRDLAIDSPYNTYRHAGLPPGPIASPGREALAAVLEPADVKDLYFVSRNDGSHHFSSTLREHERAVDEYQRRRRRPSPGPQSPDG